MKTTGRTLRGLLFSAFIFASNFALAELIASVDRDRVSMGDTLRLTVSATQNERIGNLDPRPLLNDFEILQRSSSSSTSIINGKKTSSVQVILEITPRRTGTLRIPVLRAGADQTNYLIVSVAPAANGLSADQTVSFEAELDKDNAYVQSQVLLTLRIMQSINLESRSVTDLQLDNAFVKQLEQNSFQRTIDGRPWLVHEIRYAIFPEESGTLEIPAQTFSARESTGRRNLGGFGSNGRQLRRSTQALSLQVLPRPTNFPGATWLPAGKVEIHEDWSTPPDQLHTGESATRTITIVGEGLQGAQLPPTLFPPTEGLKYYPDQPVIGESESSYGLTGSRKDSAALIPTREGSWKIPEISIPWWDSQAGEVRYAVLPETEIVVSAGTNLQLDTTPITVLGPEKNIATVTANMPAHTETGIWKIVAIGSILGWLCTLAYILLAPKKATPSNRVKSVNLSEKKAFTQLLAACSADNASFARKGIIDWACTLASAPGPMSLEDVDTLFKHDQLSDILASLNKKLYREGNCTWDGAELAKVVRGLRKTWGERESGADKTLELYPA